MSPIIGCGYCSEESEELHPLLGKKNELIFIHLVEDGVVHFSDLLYTFLHISHGPYRLGYPING